MSVSVTTIVERDDGIKMDNSRGTWDWAIFSKVIAMVRPSLTVTLFYRLKTLVSLDGIARTASVDDEILMRF